MDARICLRGVRLGQAGPLRIWSTSDEAGFRRPASRGGRSHTARRLHSDAILATKAARKKQFACSTDGSRYNCNVGALLVRFQRSFRILFRERGNFVFRGPGTLPYVVASDHFAIAVNVIRFALNTYAACRKRYGSVARNDRNLFYSRWRFAKR